MWLLPAHNRGRPRSARREEAKRPDRFVTGNATAWVFPARRGAPGKSCAVGGRYRLATPTIIRLARRLGAAPRSRGGRPAIATRRAGGSVAGHQQPACYPPATPPGRGPASPPLPRCLGLVLPLQPCPAPHGFSLTCLTWAVSSAVSTVRGLFPSASAPESWRWRPESDRGVNLRSASVREQSFFDHGMPAVPVLCSARVLKPIAFSITSAPSNRRPGQGR